LRIFGFDTDKVEPSYSRFAGRIHPEDRPLFEQRLHQAIREGGDFEHDYRIIRPDGTTRFVRSVGQFLVYADGDAEFVGTVIDITEWKQAEEINATLVWERNMLEQQRAAQLAKANEALRGCLDMLASVPELDDFLGQVMAAITRQLGGIFSTLRMLNLEQNRLTVELVFRGNRVTSPDEAEFPESWRSRPPDEQNFAAFLSPTNHHYSSARSRLPNTGGTTRLSAKHRNKIRLDRTAELARTSLWPVLSLFQRRTLL
jgi:PAS domain S-box-containing protein